MFDESHLGHLRCGWFSDDAVVVVVTVVGLKSYSKFINLSLGKLNIYCLSFFFF